VIEWTDAIRHERRGDKQTPARFAPAFLIICRLIRLLAPASPSTLREGKLE